MKRGHWPLIAISLSVCFASYAVWLLLAQNKSSQVETRERYPYQSPLFGPSFQHPDFAPFENYHDAPGVNYNQYGGAASNFYTVFLHEDHTLEQHSDFIGLDIAQLDDFKYSKEHHFYKATLEFEFLHNTLRRDPGVLRVKDTVSMVLPSFSTDPWSAECEPNDSACIKKWCDYYDDWDCKRSRPKGT